MKTNQDKIIEFLEKFPVLPSIDLADMAWIDHRKLEMAVYRMSKQEVNKVYRSYYYGTFRGKEYKKLPIFSLKPFVCLSELAYKLIEAIDNGHNTTKELVDQTGSSRRAVVANLKRYPEVFKIEKVGVYKRTPIKISRYGVIRYYFTNESEANNE